MPIEVAERLGAFVVARNVEARGEGWLALRAVRHSVARSNCALLETNVPLTLAATNDVDVYADFAIEGEFRRLLAARGRELDSLGSEVWMPAETEYSTLFVGHFITLLVADAESVLVSKALKAARKNRPLLTEYLARSASRLAACAEVPAGPGAVPMKYRATVRALRRGDTSVDFGGIPGKDLARWVPRVGRSGTLPSRLRCFRLTANDSRLLSQLSLDLSTAVCGVHR